MGTSEGWAWVALREGSVRAGKGYCVVGAAEEERGRLQGVASLAKRNTSCHVRVFPHLLKLSPGYFWPFQPLSLASPCLASPPPAVRHVGGSRNTPRHDSRVGMSPHIVPLFSPLRVDDKGISAIYNYRHIVSEPFL